MLARDLQPLARTTCKARRTFTSDVPWPPWAPAHRIDGLSL